MILLIPISALLFAALIISLFGIFRPKFIYHWWIAIIGTVVAWISLWFLRIKLPTDFGSLESIYNGLSLPSIAFQIDEISWQVALAVVTLCLAVLLTEILHAAEINWMVWAGNLGITAIGLAAILSANPSSLLIFWTFLDLIELGILMRQIREEKIRQRIVLFFGTNILGSMLLIGAMITSANTGDVFSFSQIPSHAQIYLLLAAGLRMGIFPLQIAFFPDVQHQRGQSTLLRLVPPAATLSLIIHTSRIETPDRWYGILIFFAVLSAVYGAIAWARIKTALTGRVFWILSLGGMIFTGAIQSQPQAALTWGLAMIYGGAILFLNAKNTRMAFFINILSLLTLTALPFTPTHPGLNIYAPPNVILIVLPLAHLALLLGYFRHVSREIEPLTGVENWVKIIYPIGLMLLPLNFILSYIFSPAHVLAISAPLWPLIIALGFATLFGIAYWRNIQIPEQLFNFLDSIFSLRWIYTILGWGYQGFKQVVAGINILLEGEGGVMWALVFLVMLVSLLTQLTANVGGAP